MATTDTQQTAQFAAQAAVSAAEAKQYLLSIQQPVIDISESVADAQNAAAAAEMARDQAQGISTSLVQTIESQLSEQEAQFESQMTTQQSSFESSQSERESSFEEKSNEFESRFSSQLSAQESTFSESQTDKENRFQQFLNTSGYVFLGDYQDGPFQFSARNQYIRYDNEYYRLNAATDVGFTTTGTDATSFANDVTHFVLMDGDTLRQDLGSSEEGMGADLVAGNQYHTVGEILDRLLSYQDYGLALPPALGRDQTLNQSIWDAQDQIDIKHRGGIFAGKETFGIRENSCVGSFRANTASGSAFVPQVAGSDDLAVLAQAGALDSVAVFADTWLGEYNSWEDIATANYTATSFTVSDASLLAKVKVGQFLMTKHASRYVGLVTGVSGTTVTVQKWVIYGTTTVGTPANGVGLYINPIIKGWAFNGNVLIGPNSRAEKCALMELGLQNNGISDISLLTGADIVALDATYGGGAGVRVRGASAAARWNNNVHAFGGISTNFRSSDGSGSAVCSLAAFYEESASAIGFLFNGKNTSRSLSFNNSSGVEQTALAPYGFEVKGGKGLSTAVSGTAITGGGKVVVGNGAAFSLVLPDGTNFTAGREIHFILTGIGAITVTSAQSGGTVNGSTSIIHTPSTSFTEATATYAGGGLWYFTR
ncbi:hypothetical protein [Klebsiella quasipneumoniae]|uniref:hypothetical protein n=1 Tax=Klebsiella quasipneumoniae TaxID=1463165 RepID=UPI0007CBC24E|nr:hypothetical protein [Klebsiella quasipneumoniae]SAX26085.1 Uncharacterised protein [Klebsiella quasipneumoniae]